MNRYDFTDEETEKLEVLLENDINSSMDYLNDIKDGEEKEFWKKEILFMKDLLSKIRREGEVEMVIGEWKCESCGSKEDVREYPIDTPNNKVKLCECCMEDMMDY